MKIDLSKIANRTDKYNQSGQNIPCTFAYCVHENDIVYPLHKPVLCREYLTDILGYNWGVLDKIITYHGSTFTGPIRMDKISLLVENIGKFFFTHIEKLWEIENKLGIEKTEIPLHTKGAALIIGDPFWLSHTVINSWYTAFLRMCCVNNTELLTVSFTEDRTTLNRLYYEPIKSFLAIPQAFKDTQWSNRYLTNFPASFHNSNGYCTAWKSITPIHPFVEKIKKYAS